LARLEKILVVDDEQGQRRSLAIALKFEGFQVTEASSSEEALEHLAGARFDAALVDVVMPGMNGLELARHVHEDHPRTKVVLVSAYHLSRRQILMSGTGAVAFLPKPYRMSSLVRFLRESASGIESGDPVMIEA
jgi:DNA-binding NtrC family response regulator